MNLEAIITAIQAWNNARKITEQANLLLAQGSFFEIDKVLFTKWKGKGVDFIHAYVGVVESRLTFFLIADIHDRKGTPLSSTDIYQKSFEHSIDSEHTIPHFDKDDDPTKLISVLSGLERSFRWQLQRGSWVTNNVNATFPQPDLGSGLFQVFAIPFGDLEVIFHDSGEEEKAIAVLGLRPDNVPELVLWADNFVSRELLADVSLPVPPFKPLQTTDFQLLKAAGAAPW